MNPDELRLTQQLKALYLSFLAEHCQELADEAARQQWSAVQYLARLMEGETQRRHERQILRRVADFQRLHPGRPERPWNAGRGGLRHQRASGLGLHQVLSNMPDLSTR